MSFAGSLDVGHALPADSGRPRLDSIDFMRGLAMIIMALDHARDFFGHGGLNPRDVADPALFLTRWITHFCAPTFIFLAGISSYLYGTRGRVVGDVSRFLLTRGFWLLAVEFVIMTFGWTFSSAYNVLIGNVIWAIGASMIVLAGLVWLPRTVISIFALALIAGHNLFDAVRPSDLGSLYWIWMILDQGGNVPIPHIALLHILYPLIPWIGVMAAGYALGPVFRWEAQARRRLLAGLGAGIMLGFVILRASNLYGDPGSWQMQSGTLATVLSFINCEKYPPSLLYLMMTLGPVLLLLSAFDGISGRLAGFITAYGRVPLIYYIAHIHLLHALAVLLVLATYSDPSWVFAMSPKRPADYGLDLPALYALWLAVVLMLSPLVRWFAAVKRHRREWWLSYL